MDQEVSGMAKVTVQTIPDHNYAVLINDGSHAFVADEPVEEGGDDLGPDPYELLLGALGACTAMTLVMYARHKRWPLYEVSVHLTHDRVYANDLRDHAGAGTAAPGAGGKIDLIHRDISVRGELAQEQVDRLLEIAERCPVHRTIQSAPKVVSTIVSGE
jgi:putative redox protein